MEICRMPIADLCPADYNPRKDLQPGDPEYCRLKKVLEEFDLVEPLVWNKRSGRLVGGHQRLKILKEQGLTEVEVSVVDLDDVREKALNVALNKTGGDWDDEKLALLLEELRADLDDLEITGFDEDEANQLMEKVKAEIVGGIDPVKDPGVGADPDDLTECPKCGFKWADK